MLSILIAARNAEKTIDRAITSCIDEGSEIILIDDHCQDNTIAKAKQIGGKKLRVVEAPDPGGLPIARQAGLDAVRTPFAAWLDADDEWMVGRADRLQKVLNDGFDIVTDSIHLYDGSTGKFLRQLKVPPFLKKQTTPARLFERNYLPGDTQVGFRTEIFRDAGGYDPQVFGPESYDLLLRALSKGAKFCHIQECGYRMYAYPNSVSRNLPRIRKATSLALKKHAYEDVYSLCRGSGYSHQISSWVLVSMAAFREEYIVALEYLQQASSVDIDPHTILEPDGPLPLPEGWRRAFSIGSLLLLKGGSDGVARAELENARKIFKTAEGDNNLGVALARLGRTAEAMKMFDSALKQFPDYLDAKKNLIGEAKNIITTHPIRRQAARFEYELENKK